VTQNRFYPGLKIKDAVERLRQFFTAQGHETQVLSSNDITIVQAKKESTITNLTGLSSALTVRFVPEGGGTRVEVGISKWIDKAAVGIVGLAVFWPLIVTSAIGFYNQQKLIEDVWRILDDQVGINTPEPGAWTGAGGYRPGAWAEDVTCASCGAVLPAGVGFCARCGADLKQTPVCAACGVKNQPGARFCSGCGERLQQ
jgi:hypothetical protein